MTLFQNYRRPCTFSEDAWGKIPNLSGVLLAAEPVIVIIIAIVSVTFALSGGWVTSQVFEELDKEVVLYLVMRAVIVPVIVIFIQGLGLAQ